MRRTVLVVCLLAALLPGAGQGAKRARQDEGTPVTPALLKEAHLRDMVRQALTSPREEYNFARQKAADALELRSVLGPLARRSDLLGYGYDPVAKKAAVVFDASSLRPAPDAAARRRAERALKALVVFALTRFNVTIDKVEYLPMGAGDAEAVEVAIKWAPAAAPSDAAALRREIADLTWRLQMAQLRLAALGQGAAPGVAPGSLSWPAYGPNYWPAPINWSWGCGAFGPYSWGYPPNYWGQPSYYPAAFGWGGGVAAQPPLAYPWWGYRAYPGWASPVSAPAYAVPGAPVEVGNGAAEVKPVETIDVSRLKPADATRLYWKGHELYWARDYERALEYFRAAGKLKMRDARMWYFKGLTELALGEPDAAAQSFRNGAVLERAGLPSPEAVGLALERVQGATRAKIREAQEEAGR